MNRQSEKEIHIMGRSVTARLRRLWTVWHQNLRLKFMLVICTWNMFYEIPLSYKIISFNVWVKYLTWNFQRIFWNFTGNILPIHWKIYILFAIISDLWTFFKNNPTSVCDHTLDKSRDQCPKQLPFCHGGWREVTELGQSMLIWIYDTDYWITWTT